MEIFHEAFIALAAFLLVYFLTEKWILETLSISDVELCIF